MDSVQQLLEQHKIDSDKLLLPLRKEAQKRVDQFCLKYKLDFWVGNRDYGFHTRPEQEIHTTQTNSSEIALLDPELYALLTYEYSRGLTLGEELNSNAELFTETHPCWYLITYKPPEDDYHPTFFDNLVAQIDGYPELDSYVTYGPMSKALAERVRQEISDKGSEALENLLLALPELNYSAACLWESKNASA